MFSIEKDICINEYKEYFNDIRSIIKSTTAYSFQ